VNVDSHHIDKQALRQLLGEQYGLHAADLRFVPRGEESYGYVLETPDQARYFVKVYEDPPKLEVRYQAANLLHTQCGLSFVVCPHATRHATFQAKLGKHAVALFDFIDGTVHDPGGVSDRTWAQIAILTASLHQSVRCPALPSLPVEQFELWFEDWLLRVLSVTEDGRPLANACEREARTLLAREKNDILATLDRLKQLTERARAIAFEPALTHGDLTLENVIEDRQGRLYVIDWSKIAIAPPERDLVNWVGDRFDLFLEAYASSYDQTPTLHPELFEYYGTFLILWAIADYGSWILLEEADLSDKEHAWTELQRRLPVEKGRVQDDRVRQVIKRVIGAC
jgi:thiamine kinase-like enzyme